MIGGTPDRIPELMRQVLRAEERDRARAGDRKVQNHLRNEVVDQIREDAVSLLTGEKWVNGEPSILGIFFIGRTRVTQESLMLKPGRSLTVFVSEEQERVRGFSSTSSWFRIGLREVPERLVLFGVHEAEICVPDPDNMPFADPDYLRTLRKASLGDASAYKALLEAVKQKRGLVSKTP